MPLPGAGARRPPTFTAPGAHLLQRHGLVRLQRSLSTAHVLRVFAQSVNAPTHPQFQFPRTHKGTQEAPVSSQQAKVLASPSEQPGASRFLSGPTELPRCASAALEPRRVNVGGQQAWLLIHQAA